CLFELTQNERCFTLPKVRDSYALRRSEMILTIDPDVLFFAEPAELLADLELTRSYFARLNQPLKDFDPLGAYAIDASRLRDQFGLELPRRFGCGLGSLHYGKIDWDFIERVLTTVSPAPARGFFLYTYADVSVRARASAPVWMRARLAPLWKDRLGFH